MTTSFSNMLRDGGIQRIEIPRMQRDYAQGRTDGGVPRLRNAFLKVLHVALISGNAVGLDFVYGEVENGTLIPLDGQQRLTTLFLLHWYLAARNSILGADCEFLGKFTYETRYSARDFCQKLVVQRPRFPLAEEPLSAWLTNQYWYVGAWRHDPTIQSMLVVLDNIHDLFRDADDITCKYAWNRLVAKDAPVINFESLPLTNMGLTDELYIKMNSRGKPLTDFEHFKADFEQTLRELSEAHATEFVNKKSPYDEFISKVDQDWSDLLWPLRGSDDIIDDKFLRLFRFLTDIVIYRHQLPIAPDLFDNDIDQWAEGVYGKKNGEDSLAALGYLFGAFDKLFAEFGKMKKASEIAGWFRNVFAEKGYRSGVVAIFDKQVDLLGACCEKYGTLEGRNRAFSLSRTLLLFAVLEYLMVTPKLENFAQRLRTLRNLIFASDNEIRLDNFSALLDETAKLIGAETDNLVEIHTYNKRQIAEERQKADFLARHRDHPELQETLYRLEDHDLLRGCLAAFDLNTDEAFILQARLFNEIFTEDSKPPFKEICASLLACGDYSQQTSGGRYQFGSPEKAGVWRQLLTNPASADLTQKTRPILLQMLDTLAKARGASIQVRLRTIVDEFLEKREMDKRFDWRYYLVKYDVMRTGSSGLYISSSGNMGFDLCMMTKSQLNSYYRDPYLLAVISQSGAKEGQDVGKLLHYGWDGYQPERRWIKMARTGEEVMSCRKEGFQLKAPSDPAGLAVFTTIIRKHNVGADLLLRVPQVDDGGITYDEEDRIIAGEKLLRDLIASQHSTTMNGSAQGMG